ncbi:MAG: leucine-rich repeat domain-containing protein [Promethearchaeota archaeon]|jgi:Leucine-rich repeat (LRR) protein
MELIPSKIYGNFLSGSASKSHTLDSLITLIENDKNDLVRKDCIETLNKLDFNNKKIFKILENILISETNEKLRFAAVKVIKEKYQEKCIRPFLWALHHETSYTCLITIINSLKLIKDEGIIINLIYGINKILSDDSYNGLIPFLPRESIDEKSQVELAEILINYIVLFSLKKKFKNLRFKLDSGLIVELDFSKVGKQVISWKDRESLQNSSDITGIANLHNLKRLSFFPKNWVLNNEYTFESSISLIETLELLNSTVAKKALLPLLYEVEDNTFKNSISEDIKATINLEKLPLSNISDIVKNYLTILYLKKKFPSIKYTVKKGKVRSLHIEQESVIKLPKFVRVFNSLRSLTLKSCKLYTLPESIGTFYDLEYLDLGRNELKTVPENLFYLYSLKSLNLSSNQLKKVPYALGKLTSLRYLNLENNNLESLPRSIGYLQLLKELRVGKNRLKSIPLSIGSLKSLKTLNLNSNLIKDLPKSIGLLKSLENLNLDNNKLAVFPTSLITLSALTTLQIEDNKIQVLPDSLEFLNSLEILKLGWNKIKKLPMSLVNLSNLKYLRLTNNDLTKVPESICSLFLVEF